MTSKTPVSVAEDVDESTLKYWKKKKERLSELNKLLDMGNNDKMKENSWNKEKECIY